MTIYPSYGFNLMSYGRPYSTDFRITSQGTDAATNRGAMVAPSLL